MTAAQLEHLIYHEFGVSGVFGDMRGLLPSGDTHATEAVELFVYRIGRELVGLDALVFTGIGENAPAIRGGCAGTLCDWGELGRGRERVGGPRISRNGSGVPVWVIPTNEELMIAEYTRQGLELNGDAS